MRLTRVFVEGTPKAGATLILPPAAAQHLTRVLRQQPGDMLRVFNGEGGEYEATIASVARSEVTVRVGERVAVDRESPLHVTLLQGIARGEKMDLILQKSTELGVTAIRPLLSLRSNVRLPGDSGARKHEHWLGVLRSACEQCGRDIVPTLLPASRVAEAMTSLDQPLRLLLEPDDSAQRLRQLVTPQTGAMRIVLMVGPEGGFDNSEIAAAKAAGFASCRLGPRVLRTETAALAALAALQTLAGDFGQDEAT